ncbi:MAG: M3 family oligoendopeptidase [Magnetococcales bacterium]|nr:M3 family oligoendopeptidase [Magnetococcales bacterium]
MPPATDGWDLSGLYAGPDDPRLEADIVELGKRYAAFHARFKGHLEGDLGAALRSYEEIQELTGRIFLYLHLAHYANLEDAAIQSRLFAAKVAHDAAHGAHGVFFTLEIAAMPEESFRQLVTHDPVCRRFAPWLDDVRRERPFFLAENVEGALAKRATFGAGSWSEFFHEVEAELRFPWGDRSLTLTEVVHLANHSPDDEERAGAMAVLNAGLEERLTKFSAQVLNMVVGAKAVEDRERGYPHPMASRNRANKVDDAVVEALHTAVVEVAAPLARRYYRLKARILGRDRLRWSDRNAPLPVSAHREIPFGEARELVRDAFAAFSPTMAAILDDLERGRCCDIFPRPGKQSGAFNYSVVLPGGEPVSFVLLNYQGSSRDVLTLAHEVGHAIHGLLAGKAQGALMAHAPMAYAETASIFGEMTTFRFLLERERQRGDDPAFLALLAAKIEDALNSVVRQIGFSQFEREVHARGRRLSAEELSAIWVATTESLYGRDGEVFDYGPIRALWSYIGHFHSPFYVYAYAFGELLTQSLYALQGNLGERFEGMYLDLLRAGGTQDATALLRPFGLDPTDEGFWRAGIEGGLGRWVEEAEAVAARIMP